MARKKKKSKINILQEYLILVIPVLLLVAFGLGFGIAKVQSSFSQSRIDGPKTDMSVLPPDIRQELAVASPAASFRVPVLMYHYVEFVQNKSDWMRVALNVEPPILEEQIQTLQSAGYTFMTAKELGEALDGKRTLPKKPVLLTFDDGHRDFYTGAFPIIKKYQVKVTNYVISGLLGGSDFMTVDQVKQIAQSGLVEVGDHTVHHIDLKGAPLKEVESEINDSKKTLESIIGGPVVSFAYPAGSFDTQAEDVVKQAGFETAMSTIPGEDLSQNNRFFIYRLRPGNRVEDGLLNFLQQ